MFKVFFLIVFIYSRAAFTYEKPCDEAQIENFIVNNTFSIINRHYPQLSIKEISIDSFPFKMVQQKLYRYEFYIKTNVDSKNGHLLVNEQCHGVHFQFKKLKNLY